MRLPCKVVYDLLPLYIDGECSEESRALVEEHLKECPECKGRYAAMISDIGEDSGFFHSAKHPIRIDRDRAAKRVLKRIKRRWTLSTAALLLLIPFVWLGVNQYRGEGISYTNLYDHYNAIRFLHALEDREYEKAFSYVNMEFYYESLKEGLPHVAKELRKEDFQYEKLEDGNYYYTNETVEIPAADIDGWLNERNEWYNKRKDMTYEQYYNFCKNNFIANLQNWEKLGYKITGFSWYSAILDESSEHEVNELQFNIHIRVGNKTVRSGSISLDGNDKGQFMLSGGAYYPGDEWTGSLLEAISLDEK